MLTGRCSWGQPRGVEPTRSSGGAGRMDDVPACLSAIVGCRSYEILARVRVTCRPASASQVCSARSGDGPLARIELVDERDQCGVVCLMADRERCDHGVGPPWEALDDVFGGSGWTSTARSTRPELLDVILRTIVTSMMSSRRTNAHRVRDTRTQQRAEGASRAPRHATNSSASGSLGWPSAARTRLRAVGRP